MMGLDMDAPHRILSPQGILQRTIPGILAMVLGLWFYNSIVPNPIESLCLLKWGQPSTAAVLDAYEDFQEQDEGGGYTYGVISYKFITRDGQEVTTSTRDIPGGLREEWLRDETRPTTLDVEYFPTFPRWNQIRGQGARDIWDWLWRRALLGTVLFIICLSPGTIILRGGFSEIREARKAPAEARLATPDYNEVRNSRLWFSGWASILLAVTLRVVSFGNPTVVLVSVIAFLALGVLLLNARQS